MSSFALRSRRVVTPDGVRPAAVRVDGSQIGAVCAPDALDPGLPCTDLGDAVLMAGLVDSHVHINEPGRSEWEGFRTATRAAAAGGVTCLMDMPLNSVPATTSVAGLDAKLAAADGKCWVDVGFCGGLVPGNLDELAPLHARGVLAFKCFLVPSGVDEFPMLPEAELEPGLRALAALKAPLLVHAELPGPLDEAAAQLAAEQPDPRLYATFLRSRPRAAENQAVALLIRLSRALAARVHVVHLSSADPLPWLAEARAAGVPISVETCPHYLCLRAEDIPDGATAYKCCPPIREGENRELLWDGLRAGLIDFVVSDHSPSPAALKCCDSGDFLAAWGGISSLQLRLPLVWSEARARGFGLTDIAAWLCESPAELIGLAGRKGTLVAGADADLVVWDPDGPVDSDPARLEHRHKLSPYAAKALTGRVLETWLRGQRVFTAAEGLGEEPQGRRLFRDGS